LCLLLGLKNLDYDNFIIGNVRTDSFEEMRQSPALAMMTWDIEAGVDACRRDCEYFSVCGGGAPTNKLAENKGFRSSRTSFCNLTQMVPIDLILDAVDRFQNVVETNEIPRDGQLSALSDSAGSSLGFSDEVYYPHQLDLHLEPIGARRVL
jgi:uncharacterized protein